MSPRLLNLISYSAATLLVWAVVPDSSLDRAFFYLTARSFANPPFFITDTETQNGGYTLRTLRGSSPDLLGKLPPSITINDDLDNVFQTSPPSPVDFAVILKNLKRLGQESVAIGMPLSWTDPEVVSLAALDQQLNSFKAAITSAPLTRKPQPSPLPSAFRRASIPLSDLGGNISVLPIVNCVSIPDVILGTKSSLAGFTILESETATEFPSLIARWDDRVVFSFQLLAALDHFDAHLSDLEIRTGKHIAIKKAGLYIPIDQFGRLAIKPPILSASDISSIGAEELIDAPADFLAANPFEPALIRNTLSSTDPASSRYSDTIVPTVSLLSDPSGTTLAQTFERVPWYAEILYLGALLSLIYGLGNYPNLRGRAPLVGLGTLIIILHFLIVPLTGTSPPTLPALATILVAIPLTGRKKRSPRASKTKALEGNVISNPEPTPPPTEKTPAKKASAKKAVKRPRKKRRRR